MKKCKTRDYDEEKGEMGGEDKGGESGHDVQEDGIGRRGRRR